MHNIADMYKENMLFDEAKVDTSGESNTGMANIDWFLLLAYHTVTKMAVNDSISFAKWIAAYSRVKVLTKAKVALLRADWAPMETGAKRFQVESSLHMCPYYSDS